MSNIKLDLAYVFEGTERSTIKLQNLQITDNDVSTKYEKLTMMRLKEELSGNIAFYDATLFLTMVVKDELLWRFFKATGDEFVMIANTDSIMNHEKAKNSHILNQAFMDATRCVVYGKIIVVEKRLIGENIKANIIPFEQWGLSTTILQIQD